VLAQDVGLGARVPGAEQRVLHQWRAGSQGRRQAEDSRQLQVVDPNEAGTLFGGVLGVGGNRRHRLAVILGLVDGQHGRSWIWGPKRGTGWVGSRPS